MVSDYKKWYTSKLVWAGVLITIQGVIPILIELSNKQVISWADVLVTISGISVVIGRIWFTDTKIY
jgi:hypothetical protein